MERLTYWVLLRELFFSYTRTISGEGNPATTLELAGLASSLWVFINDIFAS